MTTNKGKIKFIYFDVGGVVILDFSKTNKWDQMLHELGVTEEQKPRFRQLFSEHEGKICVGEDINIFVEEARQELGINFSPNYNMTQDFVDHFEVNKSISKLIPKIKKEYKIGLLTGMYPNMLNMIFSKGLMPKVEWDVIIDSSLEKLMKPDLEIYKLAETKAKVAPGSILFVDNNPKLLEPARQRGWLTFEYDPSDPETSTDDLQEFIYNHSFRTNLDKHNPSGSIRQGCYTNISRM